MNNNNFKLLPYFIGMAITLLFTTQIIYGQIDWIKRGSDPDKYEMGIDSSIQHDNQRVRTIKAIDSKIQGYGVYRTNFKPSQYLGKRVRMTGYMKTKDVAEWAGFWCRVDPKDTSKQPLAFDNMEDRPVKGTTNWQKYALVLDVPGNASNIVFGALLGKTGQIWFSNPVFEVVDNSVSTTGLYSKKDSELVAVTPQPCETESTMKSLNSDVPTLLRLRNNTSGTITFYWINFNGKRNNNADKEHQIAAGEYLDAQTYVTHPFVVIGADGKCYGIYKATAKPSIAIIKD